MTVSLNATFDGKVLVPQGHVDLPKGAVLHLRVEVGTPANGADSLAALPACGLWADHTDLQDTATAGHDLRRRVENREDHRR